MTPLVFVRRLAYRLAFTLLRGWWWLRRPSTHGVKCVLTDAERVLLVRHTYGPPVWELPGGSPRRGEPYRDAARREMREELGVTIEDWQDLGALQTRIYHRRDTLHIFRAEVGAPAFELDLGELQAAQWFLRGGLPADRGPSVAAILERVG